MHHGVACEYSVVACSIKNREFGFTVVVTACSLSIERDEAGGGKGDNIRNVDEGGRTFHLLRRSPLDCGVVDCADDDVDVPLRSGSRRMHFHYGNVRIVENGNRRGGNGLICELMNGAPANDTVWFHCSDANRTLIGDRGEAALIGEGTYGIDANAWVTECRRGTLGIGAEKSSFKFTACSTSVASNAICIVAFFRTTIRIPQESVAATRCRAREPRAIRAGIIFVAVAIVAHFRSAICRAKDESVSAGRGAA